MSATKRTLISLLFLALLAGGCRSSTRAAEIGRLTIISEPVSGADIYLNERKQALKTNAFFSLKPGLYRVRLVKAGTTTDEPLVGEAEADVKAGQSTRVALNLNNMKIVPAAGDRPLQPQSQAQKAILDYYAALQTKDWQKAFAYFNRAGKWTQGGLWRFSKTARRNASIKVVDLKTESSDPTKSIEINRAAIEVTPAPTKKEPAPQTRRVEILITTVDELGGLGLPKIESIVDSTAAPGPQ